MKRNYLKAGWGRSIVFITALFVLIVLGLIQPHASEKVVKYANPNYPPKMKLNPMMLGANSKLPDILYRLDDLREKLQQLNQAPKLKRPGLVPQTSISLFSDKLRMHRVQMQLHKTLDRGQVLKNGIKGHSWNLRSKQIQPAKETKKLEASGDSVIKGNIVEVNGETGSIRGTIICAGCGEGEILVTAFGDVPGPPPTPILA